MDSTLDLEVLNEKSVVAWLHVLCMFSFKTGIQADAIHVCDALPRRTGSEKLSHFLTGCSFLYSL